MTKVKSITIDNSCFTNNTAINSVDCGNNPWKDSSMNESFKGCSSLTSISNIKNDITNLDSAFEGCSLLSGDIKLESENISSATNIFTSTSLKKNVFIPYESTTYNTLTALGYDENGSKDGVYLKDANSEYDKWYNWESEAELGEWVENTNPGFSRSPSSITYGNEKFVAIIYNSNVFAYSTNGINWTQGTIPCYSSWRSITYGNGKFVAISGNMSNVCAYSEDGINWTQGTLPSSQYWSSVTYGNDKFVAIDGGNYSTDVFAYSNDGINWTQGTLPSSQSWSSIAYGNGRFVALVTYNSNVFAYSNDGINWTQGTMPTHERWSSIAYGNGKFVAVADESFSFAYSTDGITWVKGTMPTNNVYSISIAYGNGKFIAIHYNDNIWVYSDDGINWTQGTMPSSQNWKSVTYGNGKFVVVDSRSTVSTYLPFKSLSCYTDTSTPTTKSKVYSEPKVESELAITSTDDNSITLSDEKTYNRNKSGDDYTKHSSFDPSV